MTTKIKALLCGLALLTMSACTAPDRTRYTLEKAGFTDISLGGYSFFECGEDDHFATKFDANNSQGLRVSGTVCCGMLKGCTVRF